MSASTDVNARPIGEAPSLDLEQDPGFHRRMWRAQRAGALILVLLAVAGVAGLLGSGPLSRAVAGDEAQGMRVEYERFGRVEVRQAMRVRMGPGASADGYRLTLDRDFLDRVRVEGIVPAPVLAEAVPGGVAYRFAGRPPAGEPVATFDLTPRSPGVLRARIQAPGAVPVTTWQIVYP
jgi:hypothetical protein